MLQVKIQEAICGTYLYPNLICWLSEIQTELGSCFRWTSLPTGMKGTGQKGVGGHFWGKLEEVSRGLCTVKSLPEVPAGPRGDTEGSWEA